MVLEHSASEVICTVRTGSGSDRVSIPNPVATAPGSDCFLPECLSSAPDYVVLFPSHGGEATHDTLTTILCHSGTKWFHSDFYKLRFCANCRAENAAAIT